MLRGLGPRPDRPHQATPFTADGCLRLCRQRQPQPEPEAESEEAHSFTVSSLAQVSRIRPVGLHFMLVMDSWQRKRRQLIALQFIVEMNATWMPPTGVEELFVNVKIRGLSALAGEWIKFCLI